MSTYEMLKDYLIEKQCFNKSIPKIIKQGMKCISQDANEDLKLIMSMTELIVLASMLRKSITLPEGTIVPINTMSFALAKSGESKDSSVNQVRKALLPTYEAIEQIRLTKAQEKANVEAEKEDDTEHWWKYYIEPRELLSSTGTLEGLMYHWHDVEEAGIGSAYVTVTELGSELITNPNIKHTLEALAKGYDLGSVSSKVVKSHDNQVPSIKALPINALMFGSQDVLLFDEKAKKVFIEEFTTKLARRSFICLSTKEVKPKDYSSIQEMTKSKIAIRDTAKKAISALQEELAEIVEFTTLEPLTVSTEASVLYDAYLEYNTLEAQKVDFHLPLSKLARKHLQWKAIKLAGALAVLSMSDTITETHLVEAIRLTETLSTNMPRFEEELQKEPYEVFVDYVHENAEEGLFEAELHTLRKLGYIPSTGKPMDKLGELATLASSYDKLGIYALTDTGIAYEKQHMTATVGVSYLDCVGTKEERKTKCNKGYTYYETTFPELVTMMEEDLAYSPFRFEGGMRGKEYLVGGCKWVTLDIDNSYITDEEAHLLLDEYNHIIARTSDKDNAFKFRVLLELDAVVDIANIQWSYFIESIGVRLGISVDTIPKAQICFSYRDRNVLSVLDASPLPTKEHILNSSNRLNNKLQVLPKKFTSAQKNQQLSDKMTTFFYAFNASKGERSNTLIRAAYHARDLGAEQEEIVELLREINNYWVDSLDEHRLETTLINQVLRWG